MRRPRFVPVEAFVSITVGVKRFGGCKVYRAVCPLSRFCELSGLECRTYSSG
jgi:hypothetical protein